MKYFYQILILISLGLSNGAWITVDNHVVSSTKLVIMFESEIAPLLGSESPLKIDDIPTLQAFISTFGRQFEFKPLFSFYTRFTDSHYQFHLHQYYQLNFDKPVDILPLIDQINDIEGVELVELSYRHAVNLIPNDPTFPSQWAHINSGQASNANGGTVGTPDCDMDTEQAWDITTGNDETIIAILDTGVSDHVEFSDRLIQGYDFINNDINAEDDHGHGTSCAGISAASGNNAVGVAGICWNCLILPVKILSWDGYGEDTQIADGVTWATDNGANVISMSLGGGGYVTYFNNAINYATNQGTAVFASTGNDDINSIYYPSAYSNAISVGALSPCNERKTYGSCDGENYWGSNYGTGLDFLAAGVRIHTTTSSGGYTATFNGTSAACPHAAGVAGLLYSADQSLSAEAIRVIMQESADDIGSVGYDTQTGYGRINAFGGLTMIVSGPEVEIIPSAIEIELAIGEIETQVLTIANFGEMDLQFSIDSYGYDWVDSELNELNYNWIDISENHQTLTFSHNDQAASEAIDLDFLFSFYENDYSSLIVNANGWVGFGSDNDAWQNTGLPNNDAPHNAIFAFWDDLNPNNTANSTNMSGNVHYHVNDNRVVIWFDNVRHWTGGSSLDGYYDFQIVLYPNGDIQFNYRSMSGDIDSATIGIQNENGDQALMVSVNTAMVQDEYTIDIKPRPDWMEVTPLTGSVLQNATLPIFLLFDTFGLNEGSYQDVLTIKSNDFNSPSVDVQIILTVINSPCAGVDLGDLNYDSELNVLDIVLIVNTILFGTDDDCQIQLADLNADSAINVLDIILVINLILDETN